MRRGFKSRTKHQIVSSKINYTKLIPIILTIIVILVIALFVGKNFLDDKSQKNGKNKPTPTSQLTNSTATPAQTATPTPITAPTATPTPTPEVQISSYNIQILNGNGKTGATADVKNKLEALGFKVGDTGNAPTWDYAKTEIRAKIGVPQSVIDRINKETSTLYVTEIQLNSDKTGDYDVQIVLGKETR
jgi:hypothetical protein